MSNASIYTTLGATLFIAALLQPLNASANDFLLTDDQGQQQSALLLSAQADVEVNGLIIFTTMTQKFLNDGPDFIAGEYVFPLPEGASIDALTIKVEGRTIESVLKEKQQAIARYTQAKQEGKRAALLSQDRPNLFRMAVANIPAGQTIEVSMSYFDKVKIEKNKYSLRLPTTLSPRYSPVNAAALRERRRADAHSDSLHDFLNPAFRPETTDSAGIPHNPIAIKVDLNTGFSAQSLQSDSHAITVQSSAENLHLISLRDGIEPMDRDFVLQWQQNNSELTPTLYYEQIDSGGNTDGKSRDYGSHADINPQTYILLNLTPAAEQYTREVMKKDVSFIIDTSGSMGGQSIRQAKSALLQGLQYLNPGDSFNIIEFDSTHRALFESSQAVDNNTLAQAHRFVDALLADGGTEMRAPLLAALRHPASSAEHLKQVVFITDGAVGNESELSRVVQQFIADTRLFCVSIGSAPNQYLFRQLSALGRGSAISIGQMSDVKSSMQTLFEKISAPAMRNIEILDSSGKILEVQPQKLADLYFGEPLQILLHSKDISADITVRGELANQPISIPIQLQQATPAKGVSKLWAKQKIRGLMDKIHLQQGDSSLHQQAIVDLSLRHNVLSQYTSFVAVDKTPVRVAGQLLQETEVANLLPRGMVFPNTALGTAPMTALSLLCLALAALLKIKTVGRGAGGER